MHADSSSAMVKADIIIAQFSDGAATVNDYWAESFSRPSLDTALGGTNDVELISGSHVGGMTTVEFRRKIVTGDAFDREISQTDETPVIYAWHSTSNDLEYHTLSICISNTLFTFGVCIEHFAEERRRSTSLRHLDSFREPRPP